MATLDSILNVVIPLLIIGVVCVFIWTKLLEPLLRPLIEKYSQRKERAESSPTYTREIIFGDTI